MRADRSAASTRGGTSASALATLLRVAYVDARYSFGFEISREDLQALAGHVEAFRARAERVCQERKVELALQRLRE